MKIIITGGAGFIGSHLAELCLETGNEVTIIDNLSTGQISNISKITSNPSLNFYKDSIFNDSLIEKLISECDIIFHLAAAVGVQLIINQPVETIETNVFGTHKILQFANQFKKRILIASTSEIYGKNTQMPFTENDNRILGPTTVSRWSYSSSKAIDEFMALAYHKQYGLDVTIFRLFNTVGPRQTGRYGMVLPNFVQEAISNKNLTIHGDGKQTRCFCDVSDVVKAIFNLSKQKEAIGQIYNIGSNQEISINELAIKVLNIVNMKISGKDLSNNKFKNRLEYVSYEQVFGKDFQDMMRRVPNTNKIFELTGWKPKIELNHTIERVTDYILNNK